LKHTKVAPRMREGPGAMILINNQRKSKKAAAASKTEKTEKKSQSKINGGKRERAGRKLGGKNRETSELEEAKLYASEALKALVKIVKSGKFESARVAAAGAILD